MVRAAAKAAANKKTAAPVEEPDLLAGLDEPEPESEEGLDLLDGISDDNGESWMPFDDPDQPTGIQGKVTYVGSVPSDYSDDDVPLVELEAADGTVWSVRGYATALRSQLQKLDPQVGDTLALKYLGEKPGKFKDRKTGEFKNYHNFKGAIRRA